jgi:RNA recognition motif-containing protein
MPAGAKERMARTNYSAGKRQRERDKARKKQEKADRLRQRASGGEVPIATVDELQGGMMTIDEVMRSMTDEAEDGSDDKRANTIPSRLFVGGLNWRTTNDDLKKKLEEFGPVTDVHIVTDRDTGDSRGFGFVTMADRKDAAQAIRKLNGTEFDGRTLVIRPATERGR